jgi:hypothetical protein
VPRLGRQSAPTTYRRATILKITELLHPADEDEQWGQTLARQAIGNECKARTPGRGRSQVVDRQGGHHDTLRPGALRRPMAMEMWSSSGSGAGELAAPNGITVLEHWLVGFHPSQTVDSSPVASRHGRAVDRTGLGDVDSARSSIARETERRGLSGSAPFG